MHIATLTTGAMFRLIRSGSWLNKAVDYMIDSCAINCCLIVMEFNGVVCGEGSSDVRCG